MSFPADTSPAELLYPDLEQELASTRKMIALVPDGNDDFKPHQKSMALGPLATHLAELPTFAMTMLTTSELDWATTKWETKVITKTADRLEMFDRLSKEMSSGIAGADWGALDEKWTMRAGDQVYLSGQKAKLLRSFGLSHMAHHRAQLGIYLRLLGVAIPGTYGPSADEK